MKFTGPQNLNVPPEALVELQAGATVAISISGGKDSQAVLFAVVEWMRIHFPENEMVAVHADLGRAEWPQTPRYVERLAERAGIPLIVTQRTKGDLVQRIEARKEQLSGTGRPFWPSAAQRYCTSDLKRDPIDRVLRRFSHVISVMGLRAEESPARARKPVWSENRRAWTKSRRAFTWNPIHAWTEEQVWDVCLPLARNGQGSIDWMRERYRTKGETSLSREWMDPETALVHPAYVLGNARLSCAICILASRSDILNGMRHHPELAETYCSWEKETGITFRQDLSLSDLILEI